MIRIFSVAVLVAQPSTADVSRDVQRSHIEGNVPAPGDFDRFLTHDLGECFKTGPSAAVRVEHELLRDGPTQSGTAYPRFYVWVQALDGTRVVQQGAVRVEAVDRKEFQVTDFLSEATIRADPRALYEVFPVPVCERISKRLGLGVPEAP